MARKYPIRKYPIRTIVDIIGVAPKAAYSTRLLRSAYIGSAIRVRRSSDNVEADIGFDNAGNMNQAALLSHCGAGSGYVVTWYDQSGSGADFNQSTAAQQPRIVNAGVVDVQNNKPCLVFDGSSSGLLGNSTALALTNNIGAATFFNVLQSVNTSATQYPFIFALNSSSSSSRLGMQKTTGNIYQLVARAINGDSGVFLGSVADNGNITVMSSTLKYTSTKLFSIYRNGTANGTSATGTTAGNVENLNSSAAYIGQRGSGQYLNGSMVELILYTSLLTDANRQIIERNQGAYYGVTVA